ncbi:nuclear fragile X mental retardation-interacting protein 1 [Melanaphis sacchari]|uniref:Nuclear fragile X mental retardation-interacting protein 1 n=1 Tax=Melanaphis sacchari TaxID=742174 RepID=A0A2H8TQ82_9HEMI|nr:nuclear fragile X mental retardation-interacting protein 1 [Melanaphis sacchari]XP_025193011.1 nuclear fragile X mental retardation-interacting protein 1 [Melanaphis sacchari]XP_025193013.1 nuclear fragile X mental retardation-interacting protein 1 [Melanaphis sacchari]
MYRPNGLSNYSPNGPNQQSQSYTPRSFQQQQFGPRFQSPPQQFTPPGSFYQPPRQHHDPSIPAYQVPNTALPPPFYQTPVQNQLPIQHIEIPPNSNYPPPSAGPCFNQQSVPPYRTPGQVFIPPIQNFSQPPPIQNYNNCPPIQNYNQPPPIQNFNNPNIPPPFQSINLNCNQPVGSSYQSPSPGINATPNNSFRPQVQNPEPYKLPADQCYQQQQSPFNLPRHEFNQRPSFRPPGQQRFPFNKQNPRYQQSQHDNRFQFKPRQQYQNYRPRGGPPLSFNNQSKSNFVPKNDKNQVACELGDCDFVGHASAVKEHQNMHHRLGLHKKVLYSNNSDAIKNWIEERKKKWPTKEAIKTKVDIEDEKNKRGERIADEDFQRFNKKNKTNNSGNKRFNNRKRPRFNGEFTEPVEEPMNGNLKRFAGIVGIVKDEQLEESNKSVVLKLLEQYDQSSDDLSDNEPPEELPIVRTSESLENKNVLEQNEKPCSSSVIETSIIEKNEEPSSTPVIDALITEKNENSNSTSIIKNKEVDSTLIIDRDSEVISTDVKTDVCSKTNDKCEKSINERGQKRKNTSKKESKPVKKMPPMKTPRTEIVERKSALLEALMGDLMRRERNTITQCICYIRNNMNRFCKIQVS